MSTLTHTLLAQADALDTQADALRSQADALRQLANSPQPTPQPTQADDRFMNASKLAQHFGVGNGTMYTLLDNARAMGAISWLTIPKTKSRIYKVSDVEKLLNLN